MKNQIFPAIRLTIGFALVLSFAYPVLLWSIAQFTPGKGAGQILTANGKTNYANVGQAFTEDRYFYSRPSAVGYNAAGSAGSNKGPSNPDYLQEVANRIDSFLVHNPAVRRAQVPSELVTASGSGLDPNISPEAARIQIQRIAQIRKLNPLDLELLIQNQIEQPLFGFIGPSKINVLRLNLALDQLKSSNQ